MKFFLRFIILCLPFISNAQQDYQYSVDIKNILNDEVAISLKTPAIAQQKIIYSFPKAIPGSYAIKDFGRFIHDFKATDKFGKNLKTKRINANQFEIRNSNKLYAIAYNVADTWDEPHSNFIFQPGGSNIEAGKNVVMNNHAFYGYFEGYKQLPIHLKITRPSNFYASTNLNVKRGNDLDEVSAKNYNYLADNPILYATPDTTCFKVGRSTINVAVYAANGKVNSKQIAEILKPMAKALQQFFGVLPVEKYQFLYFFDDADKALTKKKQGGYGALEHNYSSLYYLPEITLQSQLQTLVNDVSSHEFLHILTPLHLHSGEIEDFDFVNPKMSQHLWLYEGVTEYFSHLVQLQSGIISRQKFAENMRDKVLQSEKFWDFAMTDMSKNVLTEEFKSKYESVYNKGALIGLALDIFIRDKTKATKDLKSVIQTLSKKYGADRPFNDDEFFNEFISASHADVSGFIDDYIKGANPIPYEIYFSKIGLEYLPEKKISAYFVARNIGLKYDETHKKFRFTSADENNLDLRINDLLVSVNDEQVTEANLDDIWEKYFNNNQTIPMLSIEIIRNNKQFTLYGSLFSGFKVVKHYVGFASNLTSEQKMFFEKFSSAN